MGFELLCTEILYDTLEELKEISMELEILLCSVEDSFGDVAWFFRLMGGNVIVDHSDSFSKGEIFNCLNLLEDCNIG